MPLNRKKKTTVLYLTSVTISILWLSPWFYQVCWIQMSYVSQNNLISFFFFPSWTVYKNPDLLVSLRGGDLWRQWHFFFTPPRHINLGIQSYICSSRNIHSWVHILKLSFFFFNIPAQIKSNYYSLQILHLEPFSV